MDNDGAKRLVIELITVAVYDVKDAGPYVSMRQNLERNKRSAIRFLKSEDCKFYCECLDIDHNCILDFLEHRPDLRRRTNAYSREGRKT